MTSPCRISLDHSGLIAASTSTAYYRAIIQSCGWMFVTRLSSIHGAIFAWSQCTVIGSWTLIGRLILQESSKKNSSHLAVRIWEIWHFEYEAKNDFCCITTRPRCNTYPNLVSWVGTFTWNQNLGAKGRERDPARLGKEILFGKRRTPR